MEQDTTPLEEQIMQCACLLGKEMFSLFSILSQSGFLQPPSPLYLPQYGQNGRISKEPLGISFNLLIAGAVVSQIRKYEKHSHNFNGGKLKWT